MFNEYNYFRPIVLFFPNTGVFKKQNRLFFLLMYFNEYLFLGKYFLHLEKFITK